MKSKNIFTVFFLLNPVLLGLLSLIRGAKIPSHFRLVIFFLIGYSFLSINGSSDIVTYSLSLKNYASLSFNDFLKSLLTVYTDNEQPDYYAHILLFSVSRFTENVRVLMGIAGVVQLSFMHKLFILLKSNVLKNNLRSNLILTLLILLLPLQTIFGLRYWTGFFMFIYWHMAYMTFGKRKYLLYLLITPLVHIGFIIPAFLFLSTIRLKLTVLIFSSLLVLVLVFRAQLIASVGSADLESNGLSKRQGYFTEQERLDRSNSASTLNGYVRVDQEAPRLFTIGLFLFLLRSMWIDEDFLLQKMMSPVLLGLLLLILFNGQGSLMRYSRFFDFYALILTGRYLSIHRYRKLELVTLILIILILLRIIVTYGRGTFFIMDSLVLFNGWLMLVIESDVTLGDVIFFLLN